MSHAGLVPAVRLAENVGLEDLVSAHVQVAPKVGANPDLKVGSPVAGMIAGADSIDAMDLLRHGAIPVTFGGIRAPSTLGSFLRAFDHGNVRQLAAVHRRVLARLAKRTALLPGADTLAFIDVDSVQRRVYGATKQGAAFGHARGACRLRLLRRGVRRRAGAHFSVTVRMDPEGRRTVTTINEDSWVPIEYPNAIYDEHTGQWVSDAEIAAVPYTAFASSRAHRTDGQLIVRRVKRLNPKAVAQGQGELFATYRYHAVFTDSPFQLTQAESDHRAHAVIEQVFADLIDGPLATCPPASSTPTPPGCNSPSPRTRSPKRWARSPPPATPWLAAPPSAPNSSRSQAVPPAADATRSPGTCPKHGPGKQPGTAPSTPPTARPQLRRMTPTTQPRQGAPTRDRKRGQAGYQASRYHASTSPPTQHQDQQRTER